MHHRIERSSSGDDGGYDLEPDELELDLLGDRQSVGSKAAPSPSIRPLAREQVSRARSTRGPRKPTICPGCSNPLGIEPTCHRCGFDPAVGLISSRQVRKVDVNGVKRVLCSQCRHDLSANTLPRCPECNTPAPTREQVSLLNTEAEAYREAVIKPLLMFAGGFLTVSVASIISTLAEGGTVTEAGMFCIQYLLFFLVTVPIGIAVYYAMAVMYMGFDQPMWIAAIQIAGIFAVKDASFILLGFLPFIGWILGVAVYLWLLTEVLEMDFIPDAWVFAIANLFLQLVIAIALWSLFN